VRSSPTMRSLRWRSLLATPVLTLLAMQAAVPSAQAGDDGGALRVRGGDISFTLQEEAAGNRFSDHGKVQPVERILARHGANFVRLRIWTDPPPGYSDEAAALTLARRAKQAGLGVLLDLHYSDFWADPGHQNTPAAWQGQDLPTLAATVRDYTRKVVADFARQGTPVDMIQVGNEVTAGFLWPLGQIYQADGEHWPEFTTLLKAGIAGARAGNPGHHRLEVMVHIDRGGDNGGSRYFLDHVLAQGVRFDVLGQSYYPMWHGSLADLRSNLNDLATRYGKDIVVAEAAYPWTLENGDQLGNFVFSADQLPDGAAYPATPQGQAAYFEALRSVLGQVPGGHGAGFLDWEPEWIPGVGWAPGEGNPNDNLTMFDFTGAALPSLQSFRPPGGRR
jgi:arabinogalactan endo-1,4-beta-galactosidase